MFLELSAKCVFLAECLKSRRADSKSRGLDCDWNHVEAHCFIFFDRLFCKVDEIEMT